MTANLRLGELGLNLMRVLNVLSVLSLLLSWPPESPESPVSPVSEGQGIRGGAYSIGRAERLHTAQHRQDKAIQIVTGS